jgi:hypothetical protein
VIEQLLVVLGAPEVSWSVVGVDDEQLAVAHAIDGELEGDERRW